MTTQKLLPALENNHLTNPANSEELSNDLNVFNLSVLGAIYGKMNSYNNEVKTMKPTPLSWEFISMTKAQEAINSWYYTPAECIQIQRNMDRAREAMSRMAQRVYEEILGSERGEELLAKAEEYNIPYNENCINWLKLIDEVENYEALLLQAEEYNIAWDLSEYDPVGLKQEIEYCVHSSMNESQDLYRYYMNTRL